MPNRHHCHVSTRNLLLLIAITVLFIVFLLSPNPNPQIPLSSCPQFLYRIHWLHPQSLARPISWQWDPESPATLSCGFRRLTRSDASDLLNATSVLVAGDSQARLLTLALLRLLIDPLDFASVEADLFRRHSDYHARVPGIGVTVDFVWAPFESNLTALMKKVRDGADDWDVIVLGSGLWHMLHVTNSVSFGEDLGELRREASGLMSSGSGRSRRRIFWLGLPWLVRSMLNTEEKRERMSLKVWEAYDREVRERLVGRSAGGPFVLLDVGILSRGCGPECTADGMHYEGAVYEAALHIMFNYLLMG